MTPMTQDDWEVGIAWLRRHIHTVCARYGRPWVTSPKVPTFELNDPGTALAWLTEQWESGGPVPIWPGGSERSIYGNARGNYAFRSWHDTVHVALQTPFTPEGERRTVLTQVRQVLACVDLGTPADRVRAARLVFEEIMAQIEHVEHHGRFVEDQLGFQHAYATQGKAALAVAW